jgi:AcrR family transcriptional regulator
MNTKEKIFDVALDLFSKKGYDSVSLREIADSVGIKKSSIYSHYSSKEAILMDIFEYFRGLFEYDELLNGTDLSLSGDNELLVGNPELFYHMGSEAIREMFSDERNLKIWKLIFIQMNYNDSIRTFFQDEILVKPLMFWEGFFTVLKESGIIRRDTNPELLAREYYSFPIFLLLEICAKYDDIPKDCLDDFFSRAEDHVNFLLDCVKVKA